MKLVAMVFRIMLTAYCFIQFAVHALWLGKWVVPRIMKSCGQSSEKRSQALFQVHRHASAYLNTLSRLGLVDLEFRGAVVQESAVIVANHPSLLDFIVLLRDFPNAICLYKTQTRHNPVLAKFVNVAGYVEGMDGTRSASKRIIAESCQRLKEGHHVVFFPEGTRSKSNTSGGVGRFRTTGFHAAMRAEAAVQPVVIYCEPLFLGKHQSWADFSKQRNRMVIEYKNPIHINDLQEGSRSAKGLADYVRLVIKRRLAELEKEES
ncbi:MAG: lysophospholipid acyltransferase family protein [Mariprofundaceae bacterium]